MTNRDFIADSNIFDEVAEMSFYEDALDLSESELQQLCSDTVRHLRGSQQNRLSQLNLDAQMLHGKESDEPVANLKRAPSSSSGDNSSIERISYGRRSNFSESQNNNGQASLSRSRQRRRTAQRSNASSNGESWKVLNSAEYSYFPTLFQIEKQLQLVLRELRDIQFSNSLQLQLIYRLTKLFVSSKKRTSLGSPVSLSVWLILLLWPLLVQLAYYFYKKLVLL